MKKISTAGASHRARRTVATAPPALGGLPDPGCAGGARWGPSWAGGAGAGGAGGRGAASRREPGAVAMATPAEPSRGAGAWPCERSYRLNEVFIRLFLILKIFLIFFFFFLRRRSSGAGGLLQATQGESTEWSSYGGATVRALVRPREWATPVVRLFSRMQSPLRPTRSK